MKNNRTNKVTELRASEYPTCNQERELQILRHITDEPKWRRFDNVVYDFELDMNNEVVTLFVPFVTEHQAVVEALNEAGMTILLDDGNKILYVG